MASRAERWKSSNHISWISERVEAEMIPCQRSRVVTRQISFLIVLAHSNLWTAKPIFEDKSWLKLTSVSEKVS